MASRNEIIKFLNEFLEIDKFNDKILNGLEIIGKNDITKIIFGVSPSLEFFNKAVEKKADMIILHHGLITDFDYKHFDETKKQKYSLIFNNNINLLAYHLPLDAHFDSGNNAQIMKCLGLEFKERFSHDNIGIIGKYSIEKDVNEIVNILNSKLNTQSLLLKHGKDKVTTVAIVSGAGGNCLTDAIDKGIDLFITGEAKEHMSWQAKESSTNLIFAGHYNSEKLGVIALAEVLKNRFNVETEFIDIVNPL